MTRVVLSFKQEMQLAPLIQAEYAKSGLNDSQFAEMAEKKLGIALTSAHIKRLRESLEIPGNFFRGGMATPATGSSFAGRLKDLEDLLLAQSVRLDDCIRKIETLQKDFLHKGRTI